MQLERIISDRRQIELLPSTISTVIGLTPNRELGLRLLVVPF